MTSQKNSVAKETNDRTSLVGRKSVIVRWLFLSVSAAILISLALFLKGWGEEPRTPSEHLAALQDGPGIPGDTRHGDAVVPFKETGDVYGRLPLSFEANHGQAHDVMDFVARGQGYTLGLSPTQAAFRLQNTDCQSTVGDPRDSIDPSLSDPCDTRSTLLQMDIVGGNKNAAVAGVNELEGKVNYYFGNDPSEWRTDVPTFGKVRYAEVYPGIDVVYYGNQRHLEYDFVVAPGIDSNTIALDFTGADRVEIEAGTGDLLLDVGGATVRQHAPFTYQETDGERREIASRYAMKNNGHVGFEIGEYDATKPLVIDPVLVYSTFLGGSGLDDSFGIAADEAGNAYVTGFTLALNFPTVNAFQNTRAGSGSSSRDAFVTKINPAGTALVYSTYLGGSGNNDGGSAIAVDDAGNASVAGITNSINFPTLNAYSSTFNGGTSDAFVAKFGPSGTLLFSTYLGGNSSDGVRGIELDAAGNIYLTGNTFSTDYPTTPNAYSTTLGGGTSADAFVTKLNSAGTALVYSTYLGGSGFESGAGIALDLAGNAYVTGRTISNNFPTTPGAIQSTLGSVVSGDAFITKLNANGTAVIYSTYLGGSNRDEALGIDVDLTGSAYVTGETFSANFPTANAFNSTSNGGTEAFVSKINADGTALVYSTYLGGSSADIGKGIVLDTAGNAYVIGTTQSNNFPTSDAIQNTFGGGADVFVTKFNAAGSLLIFSTYLGGSGFDSGEGIALDGTGNIYLTGSARTNFPTTPGSFQPVSLDNSDAFIAKIDLSANPSPTPTPSPAPTPPDDVCEAIVDGGFEAGIPNPHWNETSDAFGTPLCTDDDCGTAGGAAPPRTGNVWAWFGGTDAAETATLGQTVTIPNGTATLKFWMRIGTVTAPFNATLVVKVDGNTLATYTEPGAPEPSYTVRTVDLSAFADGGQHQILFEYVNPAGSGTSNFVVDDVSLETSCPDGTPTPTPIPTPSPSPTSTPTPGCDTVFSYENAVGVPIPDNNAAGVNITVPVTNAPILSDVRFRFDGIFSFVEDDPNVGVAHTYVGDLIVTVTSPMGTSVTIVDRPGRTDSGFGCNNNNFGAILLDDDGGFPPIENGCDTGGGTNAGFPAGNYSPNNPFSAFDGENPNGDWIIHFSDRAGGDTGRVHRFSLIFEPVCGTPTPTPSPTPSPSPSPAPFSAICNGNTTDGATWQRPAGFGTGTGTSGSCDLSTSANATRFKVESFTVAANGNYTINNAYTGFDGFIFLYENGFVPTDQCVGMLALNDDFGGTSASQITNFPLNTGTTYFVVTTGRTNADFGAFTTTITGPGEITATCDLSTPTPTPTPVASPTPTPTPAATPSPSPSPGGGLEGDLASRPNGDGFLLSNDVTLARQFVVGLLVPTEGTNEFQRADTAPLATRGDGILTAGDVTQIRRYVAGIDPTNPAGGPTGPARPESTVGGIVEDLHSYFFGREMRVAALDPKEKGRVNVAVEFRPYGDEVAASFTLEYDHSLLSNPQISLGEAAPEGAVLTVNTNEAGKIGILVDSTEAFEASAVPRRFLIVMFDVTEGVAGETAIRLTDSLAYKGMADANGNTVRVRYVDGVIKLPKE